MTTSYVLYSRLRTPIENFIRPRRLSGTDYASQIRLLTYFDRFLLEHYPDQLPVSREIIDAYQRSLTRLAPRSRCNRMSVVSQLCRHLATTDPLAYLPEPLPAIPSVSTFRPYIYSRKEIRALLAVASELPPSGSLRPHTWNIVLGLLYCTGMRIGQARALNIEHFLPAQQQIYIAEGKFRKARWIVLSDSTCGRVQHYLSLRLATTPRGPDAPLLLNQRGRRLCHSTLTHGFKRLLKQCGIGAHRPAGPRIHDLRHTFAVHRLLAWYRDGKDVNARLPAPATYMGHVDVSSTRAYLRPTTELLAQVHQRFHNYYLTNLCGQEKRS